MFFNRLAALLPRPFLSILILVTIIIGLIGILLNPNNAIGLAFIIVISISLQIWISQNRKIFDKLVPLRKLSKNNHMKLKEETKILASYILPLLPIIAIFWFSVSLFILVICILFFMPLVFFQVKKILNKTKDEKQLKRDYIKNPSKIIVYLSGPPEVYYQIDQWLSVLEKLSFKVAIILRDSPIFDKMQTTNIDIYYAKSERELEWLLLNGAKIILYPNNRERNANALRFSSHTHIFINHGESDKATNQSKVLMAYDYLFVGGPLARNRLLEAGLPVRNEQAVYVGRPQAELIIKSNNKLPKKITKLLYAPTWEGDANSTSYSSVNSFGLEVLEALINSKKFEIKIKPHPLTGTNKTSTKKAFARMCDMCKKNQNAQMLDFDSSLYDAMNWSEVLICDISAVLNEYLISKKPIILCNVMKSSQSISQTHSDFPSSKAANILSSGAQIIDVIDEIEETDPLKENRVQTYQTSLGGDNSFERFENALKKLLNK